MALQVWEGFDHYNGSADLISRSGFLQWQFPDALSPFSAFTTGRNGFGKSLQIGTVNAGLYGGQRLRGVWAVRNAEVYFGIAVYCPAGAGVNFSLVDTVANAPQVGINFNPNNYSVQVWRGTLGTGTQIALSNNNVWAGDVWNFIEIHYKINGSTGAIDARVNGVSVFGGPVTGLNTQATANAWSDAVDISVSDGGSQLIELDDLYYADTATGAGTFPANSFLGDCRVATLFATGNGSVQFTPLTGANWQEISEHAMDSDTSYNYSSTPGQEDTFTFGALSATINVIFGVQITIAARKDDGSSRVIKAALISSATEVYGSNHSIPDTNYAYFTDIWILDPHTSSNWTLGGVNGATYGYNLVS